MMDWHAAGIRIRFQYFPVYSQRTRRSASLRSALAGLYSSQRELDATYLHHIFVASVVGFFVEKACDKDSDKALGTGNRLS